MKKYIEKHLHFVEEILNRPLKSSQIEQFDQFLSLLQEYNRKINLTSIKDPKDVVVLHFSDSLTCLWETGELNGVKVADVGTGGGFPGIPLKIACPDLELTLVESAAKKARFLEVVVAALDLTKVDITNIRIEEAAQNSQHREQYDWALSRAVAPLATLAEYLLPLAKVGGRMLAMKGADIDQEYQDSLAAVEILGGAEGGIRTVQLAAERSGPELAEDYLITRRLVVFNKVRSTPAEYPRRIGVPKKRPLK